MSDRTLDLLLTVLLLCAAGAFWPLIKSWLARRGMIFRSMKEQRELDREKKK